MKSPLSRAFSVPDVHPRPRKHLSRCTLDCGFKTPESPALRGFVAERCPIRGTSLYLVLKSNGLLYPKIQLKKFDFSPKSVPANSAKKLPPQRCFKPFLIAFFNFSHKRRNVRFKGLRRVHTPPHLLTAHTAAHRAKHGAFRMGWYHYPRSVPHVSETLRGRDLKRQTLPLLGLGRGCSQRTQRAFGTAMRMMRVAVPRRRGPAGLRDPIAVSLTAPMGFAVLVDRDYRVRKKAHFVFMRRAVLPALPAPSAALLYALMH